MPWATPSSVSTGDVLTASKWNQDVVTNTTDLRSYQNRFASQRYSGASDLTLNSTSWATVPSLTDVSVGASVGDVLMYSVSMQVGNEAVGVDFDVVTIVSAAVVNSFTTGSSTIPTSGGIPSWYCGVSALGYPGAPIYYTVVAGDISSGTVTCRLRYKTTSAANKSIYAKGSTQYYVNTFLRNLGPVTT